MMNIWIISLFVLLLTFMQLLIFIISFILESLTTKAKQNTQFQPQRDSAYCELMSPSSGSFQWLAADIRKNMSSH